MRSSDCDILIVPGLGGAGPDHWQSRWERQLSTARRVEQAGWDAPRPEDWVPRLAEAAAASARPVVFVAHGLGAVAVAHAAPLLGAERIAGAFLVAPPDLDDPDLGDPGLPPAARAFAPVPRLRLPFPSVLVASRTDPFGRYERAERLGGAWGSAVIDAGASGHIGTDSGHGPWPEGLMSFGGFLRRL